MPQKRLLLTTGYAGCDPVSFLKKLREHHVTVVVDVRRNPISRKRGFSRSSLSEFLAANAVEYVHESRLGVPDALRKQLKTGERDLGSYFDVFREYLGGQTDALDRVYGLAIQKRCCLVCLEHLPEQCHRKVVAEAVEARNGHRLTVVHV